MSATPYLQIRGKERYPATITWMRWVTPDSLILQNNQRLANRTGGIVRLRAGKWEPVDEVIQPGQHAPFNISFENFIRDRSILLGFNEAGDRIFVATNSGH